MRALGVVVPPPGFDDDPRLGEAVEDLAVEELVAELRVEALAGAVLPRAARLDEGGLRPDGRDPLPHRLGDELGAVVRPDVARHAAEDEEVRQHVDDVRRPEPAVGPDRQALTGVLVDDVEHAELASIMGPVLDEAVRPDVVGTLRPQADARPVAQPEPGLLWLLARPLQPLPSPDPLDALGVRRPARVAEHRVAIVARTDGAPMATAAVAVAAVLGGERDDVGGQSGFIGSSLGHLSLRRAVEARPRRPSTRHAIRSATSNVVMT